MVPMYIRKDAHGKAMSIPEKKILLSDKRT